MSPPIRKNASCTEIGLLAWLAVEPAVPTVSRAWARLLDLDLGGSLGAGQSYYKTYLMA